MKFIQKSFMILLVAVIMILVCVISGAGAYSVTQDTIDDVGLNSTEATVYLNLKDSYTITLPDYFEFGMEQGQTLLTAKDEIVVTLITFDADKQLNVTVDGDDYYQKYLWNLTSNDLDANSKNYTVQYYMSKATTSGNHIPNPPESTGVIVNEETLARLVGAGDSVLVTNSSVSQWIHMKVPVTPQHSGVYNGKVTFTVSIEDNPELN